MNLKMEIYTKVVSIKGYFKDMECILQNKVNYSKVYQESSANPSLTTILNIVKNYIKYNFVIWTNSKEH
jgi:hypothetical protein